MSKWSAALLVAALALGPHPRAAASEVRGPVRFVPEKPGAYVRVEVRFAPKPGVCPARQPRNLHAAYPGTLEVGRRGDGLLYMVTELDFPTYLAGIAEVPRNWPAESLKAQLVAARTYAEAHMNPTSALAKELHFDLCATDACQVYRGRVVSDGAWGADWRAAVAATSGEILEWDNKPASTFYFSTSNGRTYSNAEIFGGTALPYSKQVQESDDKASPLSSWKVTMPLADLAETLRRAGSWGAGGIQSVSRDEDTIAISGSGSPTSLSVEKFRNQVNSQAVCLVPTRYPTPSSTGRPLPQVLPSKWFELRIDGANLALAGSGWGHGVGMVQWGAKGKAERGLNYADILAYYYGGLRPARRSEPGHIRIGLATDIEEMTIERNGDLRVEGASPPGGPIQLRGGRALTVGKGSQIAPTLRIGSVSSGPAVGGSVFSFELSDPANVIVSYRGPSQGDAAPLPFDRGSQTLTWDTSGVAPGNYEIILKANDGVDEVSSEPQSVVVTAPSPSPTTPSPSPRAVAADKRRTSPLLAGAALLAVMLATVGVILRKRRVRASG